MEIYQKKTEDSVLLKKLGDWKPDNVLDIGANQGESVMRFKGLLWPDISILSFEPRPMAFKLLSEVVNRYPGANCLNFGLGNVEGAFRMHETFERNTKSGGGSSLLNRLDIPEKADVHPIMVKIKKLDDIGTFFPDFSFTNLFIKVDVEGFAKYVIDGGKKIFSQAKACLIEVNIINRYGKDQTTHEDIVERMESMGFEYQGPTRRIIVPAKGGLLWQDELWMKK